MQNRLFIHRAVWPVLKLTLTVVLLLVSTHRSFAGESFYTAADAGLNFLTGGRWAEGSPLRFDTGYRVSVVLGYSVTTNWSLELETGVLRNTAANPEEFAFGVAVPQELNLLQVPVLIDAVYRPSWGSKFKPFFGLGAGCTLGNLEVINPAFSFYPTSQDSWDVAGAAQAMAGIELPITRRWDVRLAYRALFTTGYDFGEFGSYFPVKSGVGVNQSVTAGFRLRF